jgi:hypothetical protein
MLRITAVNGAGMPTVISSDGFRIDQTPAIVKYLHDNIDGNKRYQSDDSKLRFRWDFEDQESGIRDYQYTIYQHQHGGKTPLWPDNRDHETSTVDGVDTARDVTVDHLSLINGAKYTVHVTAHNGALMPTIQESEGIVIDTTPPVIKKVRALYK